MTTRLNINTQVFDYIINAIDNPDDTNFSFLMDSEKLEFLFDRFNKEYNDPFNKVRYPIIQDRFSNWISGLPSVFNVDFENHKILEISSLWGSLNKHSRPFEELRILNNWFRFISNKTFILARKLNIKNIPN